jgi:hypothetical protein
VRRCPSPHRVPNIPNPQLPQWCCNSAVTWSPDDARSAAQATSITTIVPQVCGVGYLAGAKDAPDVARSTARATSIDTENKTSIKESRYDVCPSDLSESTWTVFGVWIINYQWMDDGQRLVMVVKRMLLCWLGFLMMHFCLLLYLS